MLSVQKEMWEGNALFILGGRFDGAGATAFDRAIAGGEPSNGPSLLDFAGVEYLSSAGLRSLLMLAKACQKRQARVWVIAAAPIILQVFELAGLMNQFDFFAAREEAARRLSALQTARARGSVITPCGREHILAPLPKAHSTLDRWPETDGRTLTCLALDELGPAIGRGGLGNTAAQAAQSVGAFLSTGRLVSLRPADANTDAPDFVLTEHPSAVPVYVEEAWQINGTPAAFVTANDGVTTLAEVFASFPELVRQATGHSAEHMAWILAAMDPDGGADDGWVGIGVHPKGGAARMETVRVNPLSLNTAHEEADAFLRTVLHVETLTGACQLQPDQRIGRYVAWLYAPTEIRTAAEHRLKVVFETTDQPPEEWEWIARRIFGSVSRLRLKPLCGGFSAVTFHAESCDEEGRRLLPTVLKISDPAFSAREDRAYDLYVSPYILNNSAVRMGRCARNEWVGLRYNFLGITGPESRLSWIGDHLVKRPLSESMPLFRDLFEKILAPWYGQAKPCAVKPYSDHDPRKLFTGLAGVAQDVLGLGPDLPYLDCPALGRVLPNPFFLLEHVYSARAEAEWAGMSSIVHGDLNLNNVLVDERENIYVIDFSETHIGDLLSDFSRIEPLVALQMTRLESPADAAALLRYLQATSAPNVLFDPPYCYDGDDPFLPKVHALLHLMREEVRKVAGERAQPAPYLLGLLRWALPTVCFRQLNLFSKQTCCYASAVLTEALLAADPEAARLFPANTGSNIARLR